MIFERRYKLIMATCFFILVFFMTPLGEDFFNEFGGMNNGKSLLETMDYYTRREFSGAKRASDFSKEFADDAIYMRTEFFHKTRGDDITLRAGLVLSSDETPLHLTEAYLKRVIQIGERALAGHFSSDQFEAFEFRMGKNEDVFLKLELEKSSGELIIKDTYDMTAAYHQLEEIDLKAESHTLIEESPFLFNIHICKLPFSKSHILVKTVVGEDFNFSKKKGLESKIKRRLNVDHVSVLYSHRGEIIDKTIDETDPSVDRLYLHLNEIQAYYTKEQVQHIIK